MLTPLPQVVPGAHTSARLQQLTGLRFFAALAIVVFHLKGVFGVPAISVDLAQGVTFFFVLSGFILSYVYPKLRNSASVAQFYRARIARIWPVHLVALILGFILIGYEFDLTTLAPNILLVQGWLPVSAMYFGYNSPSWSVSAELFFYLAFPLLIVNWDSTWRWKISCCVLLTAFAICLGAICELPEYENLESASFNISQHGLVYIGPLARLLEFVLGIGAAQIFRRWQPVLSLRNGTFVELGAIVLCAIPMIISPILVESIGNAAKWSGARMWLTHSSAAPTFAILILVFGWGKGLISRFLAMRLLVFLGEVSFSMYLVHQLLIIYYQGHSNDFVRMGNFPALFFYFTILLATSIFFGACLRFPLEDF